MLPAGSSLLAPIAIIMHFMSLNQAMNFQFNAAFSVRLQRCFYKHYTTDLISLTTPTNDERREKRNRETRICYDIALRAQ